MFALVASLFLGCATSTPTEIAWLDSSTEVVDDFNIQLPSPVALSAMGSAEWSTTIFFIDDFAASDQFLFLFGNGSWQQPAASGVVIVPADDPTTVYMVISRIDGVIVPATYVVAHVVAMMVDDDYNDVGTMVPTVSGDSITYEPPP